MAYIKWRRNQPYMYRSERETVFKTTMKNGRYETEETEKVTSTYLGSYRKYRAARPCGDYTDILSSEKLLPCGDYTDILSSEKLLKMMAKETEKLAVLKTIDEEVRTDFEEGKK